MYKDLGAATNTKAYVVGPAPVVYSAIFSLITHLSVDHYILTIKSNYLYRYIHMLTFSLETRHMGFLPGLFTGNNSVLLETGKCSRGIVLAEVPMSQFCSLTKNCCKKFPLTV